MTKYTATYKLPSPDLAESADGPLGFSNLANATETALVQVRKSMSIGRYRSTDNNISSGTTLQTIGLDGQEWNSGFTATSSGIPIIPVDGYYLCIANAIFVNLAGGARQIAIAKNGVVIPDAESTEQYASADRYTTCHICYAGFFSTGQQITMLLSQSSGKPLLCTSARLSINLLAYK